jgi:hypothetical protein
MIIQQKSTSKSRTYTNLYLFIFLITVLLLQGCKEAPPSLDDNQGLDEHSKRSVKKESPRLTNYEQVLQRAYRHSIQLSEQVPGFGGFYLDKKGTRLVIRTTEQILPDRANVESEVRDYLKSNAPGIGKAVEGGIPSMVIEFEEADHQFKHLLNWRVQTVASVRNQKGVTLVSLSQKNNRIRIGIEEERFKNQIHGIIDTSEVPKDAITLSVTGSIIDDVSNHTLRDMIRPLTGGLENNLYSSTGTSLRGACTYGFNVYLNNNRYWITNSHCTRERFSVHGSDEYYQSSILDGSAAYVGFESHDPYLGIVIVAATVMLP